MTPALNARANARTVFCHGRISTPPLPASAGDGGRTHGQNTSAAPNAVDIPATVTIPKAIATALSDGGLATIFAGFAVHTQFLLNLLEFGARGHGGGANNFDCLFRQA
jgi:hypothetical protein